MSRSAPPIVFLAFANDRVDKACYLRNLPQEQRQVREATATAEQAGLCEVVERANATVIEVFDVFQDARYRNRVAIFHFGGHADSGVLLFESLEGAAKLAHAGSLARFLGEQRGLELVFLNGCATQGQTQELLAAGVPAVIATSEAIQDAVATELSSRFYRALASGAPLRTAFTEAVAAVQTRTGEVTQPWNFYVAPGAEERVKRWSLPWAARDPLFGLPSVPAMDLPLSPFKHLASFTREDAPVFFGRGHEIRELFEAVTLADGAPIVLLFGDTGAGKSSLLAAGLQPRLEASHEVLYLRRDSDLGLADTLAQSLADGQADATGLPGANLRAAWCGREEETGKPLVVILDQAEEAWTCLLAGGGEVEEFAVVLRSLFAVREDRPQGRLILGFRKEWLAEVLRLLDAEKLPRTRVEVTHLDRDGIVEVVVSLAVGDRLRRQYRLEIDPELPSIIAHDLVEQRAATIAPILQILLTKMWVQATTVSPDAPRFTVDLYDDMKRRGLLLDDFIEEQLSVLREWSPDVVDSGLVLDLLAHHTTPLGTAEMRRVTNVVKRYSHRREIVELLEVCKDRYLLIGTARLREGELLSAADEEGSIEPDRLTIRLAHDTLAPLVRRRFEASDLPGQQALRILKQRAIGWAGEKAGATLDEFDLARVEGGQMGMRSPTPDEERLVAASRRQADRRKLLRRSLKLAAVLAVASVLGASLLAWRQRKEALAAEGRARDRERAALAASLVVDRPKEAGLVLLEVEQTDTIPTASYTLHETLVRPLEFATLTGHLGVVVAAFFSPDGSRVVSESVDQTERIWNAADGQLIAILKDSVRFASFSPDGSRLMTESGDNTVRVWNAATGQPISTLNGYRDGIWESSFSPDGTRVVIAAGDDTARIWNASTGQPIATLIGHTNELTAASFSPEGTRVVTGSEDRTARIWNAAAGEPLATLVGHTGGIYAVSFSSDGTRVVTTSKDNMVRIWNSATGRPIAALAGHTTRTSFSPEGSRVITVSDNHAARIWSITTGELLATLTGHMGRIRDASFSRDGSRVVTASEDKTARIWNSVTGQPIVTLVGNEGRVFSASFSSDGTRVVTASEDKTARIWNSATGQLLATMMGHTDSVSAAYFNSTGTRVVTASDDWTARIWNTATDQPTVTLLGQASDVTAASISRDGTRVVTNEGRIWNATTGEQTATLAGHTGWGRFDFSPDGKWIVKAERIWAATTGQPVAILKGQKDQVRTASFSPDSKRIVTVSDGKTARIWNAATGQPVAVLTGHMDRVLDASFSPDGKRIVTSSEDKTARIWNATTGQPVAILEGHKDRVRAASFSPPANRVVTVSYDKTARIWNATTGQTIAILPGQFTAPIESAAFSPNGTRVVTTADDDAAKIWNAATGQLVAVLTGHTSAVHTAAFSPNGTQVMTVSEDETARIWSTTGQMIATLRHSAPIEAASFSLDGTQVVTVTKDARVRIWRLVGGYLQSRVRARTALCLAPDVRQVILGESSHEATAHEKACKACVPKFFARLTGVPSGDWQTYMAAWKEYQRCYFNNAESEPSVIGWADLIGWLRKFKRTLTESHVSSARAEKGVTLATSTEW